jgi:hypothetical protein
MTRQQTRAGRGVVSGATIRYVRPPRVTPWTHFDFGHLNILPTFRKYAKNGPQIDFFSTTNLSEVITGKTVSQN